MSRPLKLILTLKGKEAKSFMKKFHNPPYNKAREETLKRARELLEKMKIES